MSKGFKTAILLITAFVVFVFCYVYFWQKITITKRYFLLKEKFPPVSFGEAYIKGVRKHESFFIEVAFVEDSSWLITKYHGKKSACDIPPSTYFSINAESGVESDLFHNSATSYCWFGIL
jgi:hypothetical protein